MTLDKILDFPPKKKPWWKRLFESSAPHNPPLKPNKYKLRLDDGTVMMDIAFDIRLLINSSVNIQKSLPIKDYRVDISKSQCIEVLEKYRKAKIIPCAEKGRSYVPLVKLHSCLLYTSPSPRDLSTSRMPSSA